MAEDATVAEPPACLWPSKAPPTTMDVAQLRTDGAPAQFEEYEEQASGDASPTSVSGRDQPSGDNTLDKTTNDRFKRARTLKKLELASLRSQATGLKQVLNELQQQRHNLPRRVWQRTAMRQRQQRIEAELLNAQLKAMVHTIVKQTRLLMSMLTFPNDVKPLVDHKRPRWRSLRPEIADALELNALLLAVDLVEMQVESTLERFPIDSQALLSQRTATGCGLLVESMDSRLLPYDVLTVSTSVWQFVAYEDPQIDLNESTVSRVYTMEIVSGDSCVSYKGMYLYRRRVTSDGRFVISWASSWTPTTIPEGCDVDFEAHESFRREGFVVISPAADSDAATTHVQTFVYVERDACGVDGCNRGAWAHDSIEDAEQGVRRCVAGEIKAFTEGVENDVLRYETDSGQRLHGDAGVSSRAPVEIV